MYQCVSFYKVYKDNNFSRSTPHYFAIQAESAVDFLHSVVIHPWAKGGFLRSYAYLCHQIYNIALRKMADNYLGRKMEEYFSRPNTRKTHHSPSLGKLLLKNRSHRAYDEEFLVREDQLHRIIEVNCRVASARNQQVLRFRPVLKDEADRLTPLIRMGGALPHLHLPAEGSRPNAYIIITSTIEENRYVDIDLGIAAQSMLLQAVEIGLNGICIAAFDREKVKQEFHLESDPLLILAIGKGLDDIELKTISKEEDHTYYRQEGRHIVPKLGIDDLIIK